MNTRLSHGTSSVRTRTESLHHIVRSVSCLVALMTPSLVFAQGVVDPAPGNAAPAGRALRVLTVSRSGRLVAASRQHGTLEVFRTSTGEHVRTIKAYRGEGQVSALFNAAEDGLYTWFRAKGAAALPNEWEGMDQLPEAAARQMRQQFKMVMQAMPKPTVSEWSLDTGEQIREWGFEPGGLISSIAISQDGKRLFIAEARYAKCRIHQVSAIRVGSERDVVEIRDFGSQPATPMGMGIVLTSDDRAGRIYGASATRVFRIEFASDKARVIHTSPKSDISHLYPPRWITVDRQSDTVLFETISASEVDQGAAAKLAAQWGKQAQRRLEQARAEREARGLKSTESIAQEIQELQRLNSSGRIGAQQFQDRLERLYGDLQRAQEEESRSMEQGNQGNGWAAALNRRLHRRLMQVRNSRVSSWGNLVLQSTINMAAAWDPETSSSSLFVHLLRESGTFLIQASEPTQVIVVSSKSGKVVRRAPGRRIDVVQPGQRWLSELQSQGGKTKKVATQAGAGSTQKSSEESDSAKAGRAVVSPSDQLTVIGPTGKSRLLGLSGNRLVLLDSPSLEPKANSPVSPELGGALQYSFAINTSGDLVLAAQSDERRWQLVHWSQQNNSVTAAERALEADAVSIAATAFGSFYVASIVNDFLQIEVVQPGKPDERRVLRTQKVSLYTRQLGVAAALGKSAVPPPRVTTRMDGGGTLVGYAYFGLEPVFFRFQPGDRQLQTHALFPTDLMQTLKRERQFMPLGPACEFRETHGDLRCLVMTAAPARSDGTLAGLRDQTAGLADSRWALSCDDFSLTDFTSRVSPLDLLVRYQPGAGSPAAEVRTPAVERVCSNPSQTLLAVTSDGEPRTRVFQLSTGEQVLALDSATAICFLNDEQLVTRSGKIIKIPVDPPMSVAVAQQAAVSNPDGPASYLLSIGISKYRDAAKTLRFAAEDARALDASLRRGLQPHCRVVSARTVTDQLASRAFVLRHLNAIADSAQESDTVVISVAGHGIVSERGLYLLMHDSDVEQLQRTAVNWEEFAAVIQRIKAARIVVLLDVCYGGAFGAVNRELQRRAADRLSRKPGLIVLTGASADEESEELADLKHGVFTAGVLDVLKNETATVSVKSAFDSIATFVHGHTDGRQAPALAIANAEDDAGLFFERSRQKVVSSKASGPGADVSAPTQPNSRGVVTPAWVNPDFEGSSKLHFAADGRLLLLKREDSGTGSCFLQVINARTGARESRYRVSDSLAVLANPAVRNKERFFTGLNGFACVGDVLITNGTDLVDGMKHWVRHHEVATGTVTHSFRQPKNPQREFSSFRVTENGRYFGARHFNFQRGSVIEIRDSLTCRLAFRIQLPHRQGDIQDPSWVLSADGSVLAVNNGREILVFQSHADSQTSLSPGRARQIPCIAAPENKYPRVTVRLSADGSRLLQLVDGDENGGAWAVFDTRSAGRLAYQRVAAQQPGLLQQPEYFHDTQFMLLPDGKSVVRNTSNRVVAFDSVTAQEVYEYRPQGFAGIPRQVVSKFSPSGRFLAVASDSTVHVLSTSTWSTVWSLTSGTSSYRELHWSEDERSLAAAALSSGLVVWALPATPGVPLKTTRVDQAEPGSNTSKAGSDATSGAGTKGTSSAVGNTDPERRESRDSQDPPRTVVARKVSAPSSAVTGLLPPAPSYSAVEAFLARPERSRSTLATAEVRRQMQSLISAGRGSGTTTSALERLQQSVPKSFDSFHQLSLPELQAWCELEIPAAIHELGMRYSEGRDGVEHSDALWFEQAQRAAGHRYHPAIHSVAYCYEFGRGVEQDLTAAFQHYQDAAELGNPCSQAYLGKFYYVGSEAAERDLEKAVFWIRKSAEAGCESGQLYLGYAYRDGVGVAPQAGLAYSWFRKAAQNGNVEAMVRTAESLLLGRGTRQNRNEAVRYLRRAAEFGNEEAGNWLRTNGYR